MAIRGIFCSAVCLFLFACSKPDEKASGTTEPVPPKEFDPMALTISDPQILKGRETWMATCSQCHLKGIGGAPKIGDTKAWAPRIAQGKETLYQHALGGFSGPSMTQMPPKGGFDQLSDEEVMRAVDFVVFASQ